MIHPYFAALLILVGTLSLRFGMSEQFYFFPLVLIGLGLLILIIFWFSNRGET